MAVKVAVTKNLVAVKGPQVAVVSGGSGSEGLPGSGNPVSGKWQQCHLVTAANMTAQALRGHNEGSACNNHGYNFLARFQVVTPTRSRSPVLFSALHIITMSDDTRFNSK